MESIFYTKYSSLLNCFFFIFFCFLLVLPVQADVWLLEPESQYIDIVEEIINNSRINYEKINTWQGELTIHEENE